MHTTCLALLALLQCQASAVSAAIGRRGSAIATIGGPDVMLAMYFRAIREYEEIAGHIKKSVEGEGQSYAQGKIFEDPSFSDADSLVLVV